MKLITVGIKMLDVLGVFCNHLLGKKRIYSFTKPASSSRSVQITHHWHCDQLSAGKSYLFICQQEGVQTCIIKILQSSVHLLKHKTQL